MSYPYVGAEMQHLSNLKDAVEVVFWHTRMDIQAARKADGHVKVFIGGAEIQHSFPEMLTFHLASIGESEARKAIKLTFGIDLK